MDALVVPDYGYSSGDAVNLLWAMVVLGQSGRSVMDPLVRVVLLRVDELPPSSLAVVAWAVAAARESPTLGSELLEKIAEVSQRPGVMQEMSTGHAEILRWSLRL